jgi:hypothetical protein
MDPLNNLVFNFVITKFSFAKMSELSKTPFHMEDEMNHCDGWPSNVAH